MKSLLYNPGIWLLLLAVNIHCDAGKATKQMSEGDVPVEEPMRLTPSQANQLAQLPLDCIQVEFPNKLGQVLQDASEISTPATLHPAFYGCFDWHSAVHGHWSLIKLLKDFPDLSKAEEARKALKENITAENIQGELAYFQRQTSTSYERTYGWAWLLKLAEELHTWDDPLARELEQNLSPLTELIVHRYLDFLPKLVYPIRVGEHTNTAFGLTFALDFARITGHDVLTDMIEDRARSYYLDDRGCPLTWEPSGFDFLSPCLEEVDLMRRVLDSTEFTTWLSDFLPTLTEATFALDVGKVSDRKDGKLVHLDGLNFSRAWVLYGMAQQYPEYGHLINVANQHIAHSLPNLVDDSYEGGHWLGSFAIYALSL